MVLSSANTVTFQPGASMKFYGIPIVNDGDKESVETFTASLNTTDSDVNIVDGTVTVTIIDDDGKFLFYKITVRGSVC